jgi:hypothetical protein
MALNKPVATGEGQYVYRPANGMYRAEFVGVEDAGQFKKYNSEEMVDKVRFLFKLFTFSDNEPVIDENHPDGPQHAVFGQLVNDTTHINGNAYRYAQIITGEDDLEDVTDLGELLEANIGARVLMTFADGKQNKKPGSLRDIMPDSETT